jgi:hypothetical protein
VSAVPTSVSAVQGFAGLRMAASSGRVVLLFVKPGEHTSQPEYA